MKKIKLHVVLLVFVVSSLLFIQGIYGYFTKETDPIHNRLTVTQDASLTVIHEFMDTNGTTYSEHSRNIINDLVLGQTIQVPVLNEHGFDSPQVESVTINNFTNTFTYRYTRKQYTLTINDSAYVSTQTPSGTYYYGSEIHLVADATDGQGHAFVKWSNGETNRDYTFQLTDDTTIRPIYNESYTITYVPNNGSNSFTEEVLQGEPITTLPQVKYDDCNEGNGTYQQLGCTYVYKLLGWYTDSECTNKIDETFVPTEDTTLYADWNKIYFRNDGPVVFDGDDIIYTDVRLFNEENARKDFIVTFTVDDYIGYYPPNTKDKRASIFTNMSEVAPYLGVQFFHDDNNYYVNINSSNNNNDRVKDPNTGYVTGQNIIFKRENGIVYYSYDDGVTFTPTVNFSSFTAYFDYQATFGGGVDENSNPWRYLLGTLSNMSIEVIEPLTYTIHYDANTGNGIMDDQVIELGSNASLKPNTFTKGDATFDGWNTQPDGSGTSYSDSYTITSDLGNAGDVITLYAQWIIPTHFYVHFDPNGGSGTMANQEFTYNDPAKPLSTNTFTRTNYEFNGWNTEADGTGTHYDDEEAVRNLSATPDDVVTLYAQWFTPARYYVHFDPNGGTGSMNDQEFTYNDPAKPLSTNTFTRTNYEFNGWNTEADGTGTHYDDEEAVRNLSATPDDVVTLYAQWFTPARYYVHFDPNGGTGSMNDQEFTYNDPAEPLTANTFTRTNYVFRGWNTQANGTGTHYDDEEAVRNLSSTPDDVVTLYAQWWKVEYSLAGDIIFDGTQATFIDTGVNIFSTQNIDKDFEIRFTFKSVDSDQLVVTPQQPTIFNVKDESNNKYPGLNIRFNGTITTLTPTYRWGGGSTTNVPKNGINVSNAPIEFIYRRKTNENNQKIITLQYIYNNFDSGELTTINQGSWTLNQPFATNVAFGGYFDGSNQPGRFFKGTLSDITFIMEE